MAFLNGTLSTKELLDSQSHIWNQIFSFTISLSVKSALELGIPDVIHKHGKPMMPSELADCLSIPRAKIHCLERLMRLLIHSKFFVKVKVSEEADTEGYWPTPVSRLLLKDEPITIRPFVQAILSTPVIIDLWSKWFVTDSDDTTPFATGQGAEIWERIHCDPKLSASFNDSMASDARLLSISLTKDCRHAFDGLKSIVDVGGGTGTIAKALVDTFPGLKCTVLDLPYVIAGLEGSQNLTYVAGDMFESIPPADCVFLKWILHDWSDEECIKILKKCKEAIPSKDKGGKVIIVEMVVDPENGHALFEAQLFFDLNMMSLTPGKERTKQEWENLFTAAGFTSYSITNTLGLRSLLEVYP